MFGIGKTLPTSIRIVPAIWSRDEAAIAAVRRAVFIDEQGVPEALEWEAIDPACTWFMAASDGEVAGVVRLTHTGHLGRMAVRREWRGKGVGSGLLSAVLEWAARNGLPTLGLNSQSSAIGFYRRFGFRVDGPEFMEAGIAHPHMRLRLDRRLPATARVTSPLTGKG